MSDDCCMICCTSAGLCGFGGLAAFCDTKTYGANGCCNSNTTAGCCGNCFKSSFNEDNFERELQRDMAETRDPNAQAAPTAPMKISAEGGGEMRMEQPQRTPEMQGPDHAKT